MDQPLQAAHFQQGANSGLQLGHNHAPVTNNFYNGATDRPPSIWSSGNVHYMVARPVNTLFTGRTSILDRLKQTLHQGLAERNPSVQCRVVITGIGGQGKSEICLRLASDMRQFFWGVFWIDVSEVNQVEAGFIAVARQLQKSVGDLAAAKQVLSNVAYPWLLVLDNADDPDVDYQMYLPAGYNGCVLITSRNKECSQYATVAHESLEALEDTDARKLLLKAARLPIDQDSVYKEDADTICSLVKSHPLALIQAGSYIARQHCTLAQYPGLYERYRQRLLRFHPRQASSRYGDVYATFEASMDILKRSAEVSSDAQQILAVLSMLDWNPLPILIFEYAWAGARHVLRQTADFSQRKDLSPWHVQHLLSAVETDKSPWDSYRLMSALHLLQSLALISITDVDGLSTLSMHPLTHSWAKDIQTETEADQSWTTAACLIALSCHNYEFWQRQREQLRPHLLALSSRRAEEMFRYHPPVMISPLIVIFGMRLDFMRLDQKLLSILHDTFDHLKLDRNLVDKNWLSLYVMYANSLHQNKMMGPCVQLYKQICSIDASELGLDHPDRLNSDHELARAYINNGQTKEAIEILERVVDIIKQSQRDDLPRITDFQYRLARAYTKNGQMTQAIEMLEEVVRIDRLTQKDDHPDVLASQHELARSYLKNRQLKKAIELLEGIVRLEERSQREDHPDLLASRHELARAYISDHQYTKATNILERVVQIREQNLRKGHPDLLTSQHELARVMWINGRHGQAFSLIVDVVKNGETSLHPEHPQLRRSQAMLAVIRQDHDRHQAVMDHLV